jgi:hypothetical protein
MVTMNRVMDWLMDRWLQRCLHNPEHVAADILEGGGPDAVKYCRRCGAVRPEYSSTWRRPQPLWYGLVALALLLAPHPAHAQGAIPCNQWSIIHDVGATSLTQLIPTSTNQQIGLCGYAMVATVAAAELQLAYGTGTNCGAGTTNISPVITLPVGGTFINRNNNIVERAPPGNAICYVSTSAAGSVMDAIVYWTYF